MTLTFIGLAVLVGIAYQLFLPGRWRRWALFLMSAVAIYALQPALPIRWLDYNLPTLTLGLAVVGWWWTRTTSPTRTDALAVLCLMGVALMLTLPRYGILALNITSHPPDAPGVMLALSLGGGFAWLVGWRVRRLAPTLGIMLLVGAFIIMKTPDLTAHLAQWLRMYAGQDTSLASPFDVHWVGFSYVAFRLIHTLRDRQMGRLPSMSLRDYVTFVIFFPAYTAGPMDRAERWTQDWQALPDLPRADAERIVRAGERILMGLFKKFIVADSLALIALDALRAEQVTSAGGLWLLLYAYALRLYFDFGGYSDIAIGLGMLFGVQLPENFKRPYLQSSIASFWQAWHITLSEWVRAYVFLPLSRALLRRKPRLPNALVLFISHLVTMMVMGLWHGVTWTFLIWGVWHGVGLFLHKQWSDRTRLRVMKLPAPYRSLWTFISIGLTFHFVLLGWVWFVLPDVALATQTLRRLFGWW